jgi:short-subunit dehydrogenase
MTRTAPPERGPATSTSLLSRERTLQGKVAVVTGCGRGIGRATARALAARGAAVVGASLHEKGAAEMAAEVGGAGLRVDVREPGHAALLVEEAMSRYGGLDVVVANAGVGYAGPFAQMPEPRIHELVDVNLRGAVVLARAALPLMLARGAGSLVFVSSIAGRVPVRDEAVYSATKAAVESFAAAVRAEVRGTGVHVGVVAPGVVATDFFRTRVRGYDRRFPRPIPPERVAESIVRLVERHAPDACVPGWLSVAPRVRGSFPRLYERLANAFG